MNDHLIAFAVITPLVAGAVLTLKIIADTYLKRKIINTNAPESLADAVLGASKSKNADSALKWGLVVVGLGISMIFIEIFPTAKSTSLSIGIMFLGAGAGLLAYYFITGSDLFKTTLDNNDPNAE